ncbi:MAG: quinone oxidoreductase [Alphaproteobacteria bacterium]|nr:quinone oxidoreductase [Alphaproteobacteria bacterium]HCP00355.1 quinone oxidoreductase [Rhodospirillaceae bacterium]
MAHAIRFHEAGEPEVMRWEEVEVGDPGPGEIRLKQTAAGLNFIDIYLRSGARPVPMPNGLGLEGAGEIVAVGEGVIDLAVGDRVGYADMPLGAYAEERVMPAKIAVKLPDAINNEQAAAMMLKGMTVQFLIKSCFPVEPGSTVLWHAAAGGVGLIACQWLNHLGVTVIGTVGSDEKAELAKAHGCRYTVNYKDEDFVARVKELTKGAGVPVVYDSVGKDTLRGSMKCLQRRGHLISFGNASGAPEPVELSELSAHGSIFAARPMLFDFIAERGELLACAGDLFDVVASGAVKIEINQRYPLSETVQAHKDLVDRKTTGSTILIA